VSTDTDAFCAQCRFNAATVCRVPSSSNSIRIQGKLAFSGGANVPWAQGKVDSAAPLHSKRNFRDFLIEILGFRSTIHTEFLVP
jgi:hypothetical protein